MQHGHEKIAKKSALTVPNYNYINENEKVHSVFFTNNPFSRVAQLCKYRTITLYLCKEYVGKNWLLVRKFSSFFSYHSAICIRRINVNFQITQVIIILPLLSSVSDLARP